jgi:hypothetical protein
MNAYADVFCNAFKTYLSLNSIMGLITDSALKLGVALANVAVI